MQVVELKTFAKQANEEAIKILKELLSEAEEGNITGLGIICIHPDGSYFTESTDCENLHALLGGILVLQHRILHRVMEIAET